MKLKMLQPRLKELPPRIPMLKTYRAKADNGRTLSLSGAAWKRLRAYVLACEPLCRHCAARSLVVPATDVDHIDNDPSLNSYEFDAETGKATGALQPLCHECHSLKTNADMGRKVSLGCDATGHPADPLHHWNKPSLGRSGASALPSCAVPAEKSTATDGHIPTGSHHVNANCKDYP